MFPTQPFLSRGQHSESSRLRNKNRQPFAGALSQDEIQALEELDSERLSANWHLSSSLDLAQIGVASGWLPLLRKRELSSAPPVIIHPAICLLYPFPTQPPPHRQHPESPHLPDKDRQPFAGALSRDEIQSLEELDSERLSANWHLSSS